MQIGELLGGGAGAVIPTEEPRQKVTHQIDISEKTLVAKRKEGRVQKQRQDKWGWTPPEKLTWGWGTQAPAVNREGWPWAGAWVGWRRCSPGGCEGLRLEEKLGCCAEVLPRHPAVSPHPRTGPWTPVTPQSLHTASPHTHSPPRSRLRPSWQKTALRRGRGAQTLPGPADHCPAHPPRPRARPGSKNSSGLSSRGSAWPGLSHYATGQRVARLSQLFPPHGTLPAYFLGVQSGNRGGGGWVQLCRLQVKDGVADGEAGSKACSPRPRESHVTKRLAPLRHCPWRGRAGR